MLRLVTPLLLAAAGRSGAMQYSLAFATLGVRHALFGHSVVSYPGAPEDEQA